MSSVESYSINSLYRTMQNGATERFTNLNSQLQLPSVLDETTLNKVVDGEYGITLEDYTDLNTYNSNMRLIYANNSGNPLYSNLNTVMRNGTNNNSSVSARDFIDNMRDQGLSDVSAFRLYTALKTYSVNNILLGSGSNSFISARI